MELSAETKPHPRFQKAMVIYNPHSGRGMQLPRLIRWLLGLTVQTGKRIPAGEHVLVQILERLHRYGIQASAACTSAPGDGTRLARECVDAGYDLVIAVGGDGTVNEVVNGLAGSEVALGVIPAGTINVFGLLMNLPTDLNDACRTLARGTIRKIDLGRIQDRYFVCMAGVGFDAFVIKHVDSRIKRAWGAIAYPLTAAMHYFTYPFRKIVVQIDGKPGVHMGYFLVVGNGKYYGGEMVISSRADMSDGFLDVCLLKRRNLWNFVGYLWALRMGNLEKYLDAEIFQCKTLYVSSRGRHPVHVDAEYIGTTPALVEVVPGALKVVVPPGS